MKRHPVLYYRSLRQLINGHLVVRVFPQHGLGPRIYITDNRIIWEEVSDGVVVCASVPSADVDLEDASQVRDEVDRLRPIRVEAPLPIDVEPPPLRSTETTPADKWFL